jgi:signal transduction histidine kinase
LELSKAESNDLRLHFESKDINQLIERSVETFKAPARAKKIKIVTHLEPLFPVKIDPSLISKVINNLIDNSLKYSPSGSEVLIESRELEVNNEIEILIRDQGIGMTPEETDRLFTRVYRAKNDTTTKIAGTGLGLYLTKFFIEAHQGRVYVESTKGVGTLFKIYLPINATQNDAVRAHQMGLTRKISKKLNELLKREWKPSQLKAGSTVEVGAAVEKAAEKKEKSHV